MEETTSSFIWQIDGSHDENASRGSRKTLRPAPESLIAEAALTLEKPNYRSIAYAGRA